MFLDPVGSLVSTLLVGGLLVGCHTFSKCKIEECNIGRVWCVGVSVCRCVGVLVCWCVRE